MSDFLSSLVQRAPDALVGWRGAAAVSQHAFMARVDAWRALALRTSGARIALYLDDSIEFGAALLGAWQAGKTVWLSADTLPASCAALGQAVDAFFGEFPATLKPHMPAGDDRCGLPWAVLDGQAQALVVHTSGSTGAPQAIPKQLAQISGEVATLEQLFGVQVAKAEVVATVSHQHIYGLLFKVLWPLQAGRAIHARSVNFPEELALALARRPCVLVASPAHLKRLPGHLDWQGAAGQLRAVFSSGGPLATEVAHATAHLLRQLPTEIYGSSETGGIAWRQRTPGSTGAWQALPGVAWRIEGASGQLEVCSPHTGNAWLRMADQVQPGGAASFLLMGRNDRIVKVEEKRISLDAMEAALLATGLVAEARVLAGDDAPGQRQRLAAFVVPSGAGQAILGQGKPVLNARLRSALAEVVDAVALPRRWRYLDQMPVNASGKTPRSLLLATLDEGQAAPRRPQIRLLERDATRVLLTLTAPAALLYFDGHFADTPVLPGVVQVDWAIAYGRQYFDLPGVFAGMAALKFQNVIRPEMPVMMELIYDEAKGSLQFRYYSDAGQHSGGRLSFLP